RRVELMLDALLALGGPGDPIPLLGDDDGGRALALGAATGYRDGADLLSTGAVLFGRGDWKHELGALREESFWLLGARGWRAWQDLAAQERQVAAQERQVAAPERRRRRVRLDCANYVV